MTDKKEEYYFSLNPAGDSNPSIFLVGQPPESEASQEPAQKPSFVREKRVEESKPAEEKVKIALEKPKKEESKKQEFKEKQITKIKDENQYEELKKFERDVSRFKKIRVIFTASILTVLLLFMFLFASPSMTLNVGNKNIVPLSTLEERVDYNVVGNKSFDLNIDYSKFNKNKNYASLGISGAVFGKGDVKIYLVDEEGKKYFLYDNQIEKSDKFFKLIGSSVDTDIKKEESEISHSLEFEYSCVDTCYSTLKEGKYVLKVETDKNTVVQINKLIFAV